MWRVVEAVVPRLAHRLRTPARASLAVVVMTRTPGRTAALLWSLRDAADEIVVALDDRVDETVRAPLEAVADRILLYPFLEPVDRPLPWLVREASTDWVLAIDDDEVPSTALVRALPRLCAAVDVAHYSIARRWLYPTLETYLDDSPWRPDYQLRLLRPGSGLVHFSDDFHRPIVATGPGRFVREPLWHLDTAVSPHDVRVDKARRYERARPGMRVEGRSLNAAFYLPETRQTLRLEPVPEEERRLLERVVGGGTLPGRRRARIGSVTREEIDAAWPAGPVSGALELLDRPTPTLAGSQRTLDARVRNTGSRSWSGGADAVPRVFVTSSWRDAGGHPVPESSLWTPLPAPIEPGADDVVPVHWRAPERPGVYTLAFALVHDGVAWLGDEATAVVEVVPQRRFAVVGADVERVAVVLEHLPEAEPVLLRRTPAAGPYVEAPDARAYLFDDAPPTRVGFASALVRRMLVLTTAAVAYRFGRVPQLRRGGAEALVALRSCRALLVLPGNDESSRRERWSRLALLLAAWVLNVRVLSDPETLMRLLETT